MKSLKTPLRYPGGKSRATPKLFQYFPDMEGITEFREPFLGGGSMSIAVSKLYPDMKIWVNDLYEPLVNFWKHVQHSSEPLVEELLRLKEKYNDEVKASVLFAESKECLAHSKSKDFDRAVAFYVINKCSFSGLTESSSFSKQASVSNFSVRGIENLHGYAEIIKNWKITNYSYESLLSNDETVLVYLDPPYEIKDKLYGKNGSMHKGFDHDNFASTCDSYKSPMLISYNVSNLIKKRFSEWYSAEFAHTYTMRSVGTYTTDQASRHELVLTNYNIGNSEESQ
jgi:DNA adenine methylase